MLEKLTVIEVGCISGGGSTCSCSCEVRGGNTPTLGGLVGDLVGVAIASYSFYAGTGAIGNHLRNHNIHIRGDVLLPVVPYVYGIANTILAICKYTSLECICKAEC